MRTRSFFEQAHRFKASPSIADSEKLGAWTGKEMRTVLEQPALFGLFKVDSTMADMVE